MSSFSIISLSTIMFGQGSYKFTSKMHEDHPEVKYQENEEGENIGILSKGHDNDIATNALEKLDNIVMFVNKPVDGNDYIRILGRKDNSRAKSYIRRDYVCDHPNLEKYKVIIPKANGTGKLGETLSDPMVLEPNTGITQTFLSIGCFDTQDEAEACKKYIMTKFARALLGILKITQDNPPEKWRYVPLQDFSPDSDIKWDENISEIDKQLYSKYKLSREIIDFIDKNVKEME